MSDRGLLFLFSILMIAAGLGVAVWLAATGQAGTVDGLFLVLTALITAAAFALYALFLLRRAMEAGKPPVKVAHGQRQKPGCQAGRMDAPERPAAGRLPTCHSYCLAGEADFLTAGAAFLAGAGAVPVRRARFSR